MNDNEKVYTFRMAVPGGWLYRVVEVTMVKDKHLNMPPEFRRSEPAAMSVTMCFVPENRI